MMIETSKLIDLPVASENVMAKIGNVKQIIIDPTNGRVLGFLVSIGGFFSKPKVLATADIKFWDPEALVTDTPSNLLKLDDIIRIKDLIKNKTFILEMPAKTKAGKSLGFVEDLLIDTQTETVVKYYLKNMMGQKRILSAEKVDHIDKAVIFLDDEGEIVSSVIETQIA